MKKNVRYIFGFIFLLAAWQCFSSSDIFSCLMGIMYCFLSILILPIFDYICMRVNKKFSFERRLILGIITFFIDIFIALLDNLSFIHIVFEIFLNLFLWIMMFYIVENSYENSKVLKNEDDSNFLFKFAFNNKLAGKKFILKSGDICKMLEYNKKLIIEIQKLKSEKKELNKEISNNKKQAKTLKDLSEQIQKLEDEKSLLEKEVGNLIRAKQFTLNITELQKKSTILENEVEDMNNKKVELQKELKELKEEKAILIDEIESISYSKKNLIKNEEFSMKYVDSLNGLEFEQYFAKLLDKLGFYDVKVTSASGDFGIDVLAYNDEILYGFQCKLYSDDVGNKAVQEAYSGKEHYGCNVAVVVTNKFFTDSARQQAKDTKVLLWDRTTLSQKLKEAQEMDFKISF